MIKARGSLEDEAFTNKFFWKIVPNNAWAGKPCYIIAGGPSLEKHWNYLLPRLKGKLTIGINRAHEQFNPTIIFGTDTKFISWVQMGKYGEPARLNWQNTKAYKVWLCSSNHSLPNDVYILKCFGGHHKALQSFPFVMEDGIGHGNNSGYGALNLAACLGANPIYLLGYDMKRDGDRMNWHAGHPEQMREHVPACFKKHFIPAVKELNKKGIEVINLNPDSALGCFPKLDIKTAFPEQRPVTREEAKFGPIPKAILTSELVAEETLSNLYIAGPYGFGDSFYCRSLVRSLVRRYLNIYVRTTLPEAFWDIENVKFVRPISPLRAQKKHIDYIDRTGEYKWEKPPKESEQRLWGSFISPWMHTQGDAVQRNPRGEESTTKYFVNEYNLKDFDFSFPLKKEWIEAAKKIVGKLDMKDKKFCIVRPPIIHKEWANYSRNPKKEYFQLLIDKYKDDYFFITLSNNKDKEEWFDGGELNGINKRYDHGELPITTIFGLIKISNMMITPPDFFSIMAIAIKAKCFCIFGGCAKPAVIFDENMDLDNFRYITPEPFCNCMKMEHKCNKRIPGEKLIQKFETLRGLQKSIKQVSVALPPGIGDMHWVLEILESFKEKNHIDKLDIAIVDRGSGHQYSSEFLHLIPFIDSVQLLKRIPFEFSINGGSGNPFIQNALCRNHQGITTIDYIIEFNSRLEHGIRIENILPEYEVNFDYPIKYPNHAKSFVKFIKKAAGNKLYLFYASSNQGNNNWTKGLWDPKDWIALAEKIRIETGKKPILIGANWDKNYADEIKKCDTKDKIIDLVGKTNLAEMLGLLREANCVVSFLSGIVILATRFKTPCASFWPTLKLAPHWHDPEKFQKSWIPPDAKKDGYYMPFYYGAKNTTPTGIFNAIKKYL